MKETMWDITEIDSLPKVIEEVLKLAEGVRDEALVLALHGDLGAGKTTFTQTLARVLGVTETVTSPTFVIMKNYATENERWSQLVHIDAYRLDAAEELQILGFADWLNKVENIVCVEWAEKVSDLLPRKTFDLNFSFEGDKRTLTLTTNHGS